MKQSNGGREFEEVNGNFKKMKKEIDWPAEEKFKITRTRMLRYKHNSNLDR